MKQRDLGKLLVTMVLLIFLTAGCTTYRYTRAFYLPDQLPEKLLEGTREQSSLMPEMFESWQVWVRFSGLYNTNNAKRIDENMFSHVQVRFVLPGDTLAVTRGGRQERDTSVNILLVDSVCLILEPLGYDTVLHAMGNRPRHQQRFDSFEPLRLPVEVEAVEFRFTARLVTPEGVEISRKEYSPRLVLWEEKRLDRSSPDIPHPPRPRSKRLWDYP